MGTMERTYSAQVAAAAEPMSRGDVGCSPAVADPGLRDLLRYWLELCDGDQLPDRRDFDPTRVASVLPYFWILRLDPASDRWRFTLAGERTLSLLGRKLVGESVEEVFADQAVPFREAITAVVTIPAVLHMAGPLYRSNRHPIQTERLVLPMRDGGRVDRVYGATVHRCPSGLPRGGAQYQGAIDPTILPVATLLAGRPRPV